MVNNAVASNTRQDTRHGFRQVLLLDPDKLGLLAAALVVMIVLVFCLYYRRMGALEVAVRATMAFVIAYAGAFVFVFVLRRVLAVERARERREKAARVAAAAAAAEEKRAQAALEESGRSE
jgi:hypothetical protein